MIISDLSYLESMPTPSTLQGGDDFAYWDYRSYMPDLNFGYGVDIGVNTASITQNAYAAAGNNTGTGNVSIGNVAIALNIAIVTQVNL
jgi:hypothetical protein